MHRIFGPGIYLLLILLVIILSPCTEAKQKAKPLSPLTARTRDINHSLLPGVESVTKSKSRSSRQNKEIESLLYDAIIYRLGTPYRYSGIDMDGYDCSGFVWKVFQKAGVQFERTSARMLWARLPAAANGEKAQFGTLVFFKGLNHVGIVRDAYSFYHVSSSQGVVRTFFTGYWESRVAGFRRVPLTSAQIRDRENLN